MKCSVPDGSTEAGIPGEAQYVGPQTDEEMYAQGVQDGKNSLQGKSIPGISFLVFFLGGLYLVVPFALWYILKRPKLEKLPFLSRNLESPAYRKGAVKGIKTTKALKVLKGFLWAMSVGIVLLIIVLFLIFRMMASGGW